MAVDKNKLIAEATRLVQRGALDKAIAAYRKILAADPKDVRVLLKVGELHQRKGEAAPAAEAFARVAETYADQGFFLKAIAVYKQIVRLDPGDAQVSERLAALYQQLGLLSDAMAQLQRVAVAAEQAGDAARLGDVLRRMVELDPEDVASTVKLGELHARAGQAPLAIECLRRAAGRLEAQGRTDEYVRVAERLATLEPGDVALVRKLAHLHLARGDTKRALAKLQLSFKAAPGDVETLHLLARAFGDLGQHAKVVSVYRELALVHGEQGRPGEARATWEKVLELAPGDEEALAALAEAPAPAPAPAPAATEPPPRAEPAAPPRPPPVPARGPEASPRRETAAPDRDAPAGTSARAAPPAPAPAALPEDAVARLLAEADVYAKYGLHDRALQHLGKVLELDAGSPDAHERARDLHAAAGRLAQAAEAGVAAVRALRGRGATERAGRALERLRELAPDHPELAALSGEGGEVSEEISLDVPDLLALEPLSGPEDDALEPAEILELEGAPDEGVTLDVGDPEPIALEGELEVDVEAAPAPLLERRPSRATPAPVAEPRGARAAPAGRAERSPLPASPTADGGRGGSSAGGRAPAKPEGASPPQLARPARVTPAPVPQPAAVDAPAPPPELARPARATPAPVLQPRGARATPGARREGPSVPASPPVDGGRGGAPEGERAPAPVAVRPPPQLARPSRATPAPVAHPAAVDAPAEAPRAARATPASREEGPPLPASSPVDGGRGGAPEGGRAPAAAAATPSRATSVPRPQPTAAERAPAPRTSRPAAPVAVEEDLSDDLEVAQFFLEQGLVDEARDALRALAAAHPEHRGVRARLDALEQPPVTPEAPARHSEHDLARALEDDLARAIEDDLGLAPQEDAFQYSVEDVFDQFKKGVEQTVRPEDSATHYDLGIAYREMGLLDDAVHEFETALRGADGRRAVDCLSMLGACRMARGEPLEAAAVLRRALASPHLTPEAAKALRFDLGDALEAAGERELALQCFRTVGELDPGYRRVSERLAALADPAAGAPAPKRRAGPRTPE